MNVSSRRRVGFTLVELLVVIGIIAVLISIIMPSIGGIRRQSKAIGCQANQKNLYAVCVQFANDHKNFLPTPTICGESPADPTVGSTCMFALEKNGVANFEVGQIWKYIPTIDSRRDMMWCPADDKEYQLNAGVKPDPDRNMSYSINANVRPNSGNRVSIQLRQVISPGDKIFIWEEVGPNDLWCLNPTSNIDDHVSGRHGKVSELQYGSTGYNYAGRGNFCFFDGHVEMLNPESIYTTPGYYSPLK